MPIGFIDSLVHNSNSKGLVDSNFTRGGVRTSVANLYDLALLSNGETPTAIGQFKRYSTIIYVENTSPLIEADQASIDGGFEDYITVGDVNLKAPTGTDAGAFYYLDDLSKMADPGGGADITVTGDGSAAPFEGTLDAWKPLSDTITTTSGSDFSTVVTNYDSTIDVNVPASFLGSVIVPDDATGSLTINVPTASEVHGVFDQGDQTGDGEVQSDDASPIAIRAINGDSYLKRIDFVDRAIIGTDDDPMGGLVVEGSDTPVALETVARFGGTDAADGALRRVTVNAEFNAALSRTETITGTAAATSILMDNAVGLALSVPSFTTAELNTNVDEANGDTPYTNKFSGLSISGLPATTSGNTALVLGPSSVLGNPNASATKVFTRALGDMAFTNATDFNIGVSTLQPHSNGNLLVVNNSDGTTATSGDLQVKLNSDVNIGEQSAVSGALTVNQSGLDGDGNGLLDATLRVYGNATIDGDLSVLGTTTTIASSTVSFEDTMLEIGVAREADGSLSPNIANNNIPDDSGLGLEVFHGTNDAGGTNAYRRPRIEYVTSNSNHQYGFWRLNHGYVPTGSNDSNGDPTYSSTQDGGRILSEGDVSLTPIVVTANEFLYHDVASDDSENDLKFVTTPTGLLKQYSQTETFTYTPLGAVDTSTYDQVFDRSYARMSVVPVTYGVADTEVEPRPNGAIRILHGLENGDGLVYVIGIVTARASGSLLPPIGAVVHPKVSTRASDGSTGTLDEYHKSCDVFVKGAIEDDAIKFIVFG